MSYEFKPGMKVVCVNAHDTDRDGDVELVLGAIYVIARVSTTSPYSGTGLFLFLEGFHRPLYGTHGADTPFLASRFRPLEEKPDAIEIFREMCRRANEGNPIIIPDDYIPEKEKHLVKLSAFRSAHSARGRGEFVRLSSQPGDDVRHQHMGGA